MASGNHLDPLSSLGQSDSAHTHSLAGTAIWTSMTTGHDYRVRVQGEYVYTEWVDLPAGLRDTTAFVRSELKKVGDKWVGKARTYLPYPYYGQTRWCSLETDIEISSISDTRIEGRSQASVGFNSRTCRPKKLEWKPFTWIPKE